MSTERGEKGQLVPTPLVHQRGHVGEAARHFAHQTSVVFGEAAVFERVTAALAGVARQRRRHLWVAIAAAATSAVGTWLVVIRAPLRPAPAPVATRAESEPSPARPLVTPIAGSPSSAAPPAPGHVEGATRIALAEDPVAEATAPPAPGPETRVAPRRYSSVLLGTRFRSARRETPPPAAAELALYDLAVDQRDRLRDSGQALATFRLHEARFPKGVLRVEVMQSIVELLPRLGRYHEALDESARLLAEAPPGERTGELRLLRGNLFREALDDCARAVPEYAAAALGTGRTADDGAFFAAACLEILGKTDEARQAYRAYLLRPGRRRAAEAEGRLRELP